MFRLTEDKFFYENKYLEKGFKYIAGVDEVGRGPLAGPVVCAAVIMPLDEASIIEGIDDSKKLSAKKREFLAQKVKERAIAYSLFQIEADEIDEINILNAVKKCMVGAAEGLSVKPDIVLVDGLDTHLKLDAEYIIKGDSKSYTIGCASVLAKVYRDKLMEDYAKIYPEYSFEKHKGYGTATHIKAIREFGLCPIHRISFTKKFTAE